MPKTAKSDTKKAKKGRKAARSKKQKTTASIPALEAAARKASDSAAKYEAAAGEAKRIADERSAVADKAVHEAAKLEADAKKARRQAAKSEALAKEASNKAATLETAATKARREVKFREAATESARRAAVEKSKREAAQQARRAAAEKAKLEAADLAKRKAAEKAEREAARKAEREAAKKAKLEAAETAKREAAERAKREATEKAERDAARKAAREAAKKAKLEAAETAKREAVERANREATEKAEHEAAEKPEFESVDKPRYYITTAIPYVNGLPHIGHAYEAITTDAIARFMRLDGYDVFFLTGADEHGIKVLQTATKEGLTPQELVARTVPRFQAMIERLNCSNDAYIRTTEERHRRSSLAIWERMERAGDIYLGKYSGWYSVRDEAYYDEDETRLDEKGQRLGPQGTPVEWVEEESYFFRLSAYQDKLLDLYARQADFVLPKERLNEVASFVRGGLRDLSLSRTTFDWGIKVPGNPKHVMYVWMDALTNYITGVGFPDTDSAQFRRYWPADLHVIGKDIVRFHAVYWPAFLMSAGIELPRRIFSHGFILSRGEKMSKSVGNVVDPFALSDAYGVDPLRYFLLREVPFGQDGSYSHEAIVNRTNADLANDLGNLAQRSLTMVARALGGTLRAPGAFTEADQTLLTSADALIGKAREAMKTQGLHHVLNAVWAVVADANRYFAGEAPWALAKTDPARQATVLYVTAEVIRNVAILAQPAMPVAAGKLLDLLAVPEAERNFAALGGAKRLATGVPLPAPSPVFPRYVESAKDA
jgi:methionyl-tRNA synthetase